MTGDPTTRALLSLGSHQVPGLWRHMLPPNLAKLAVPAEGQCTCSDCPEVARGFRPDYRCCTYHPRVSNFLLGLAATDPATKDSLARPGVLAGLMPEGFQPSPRQWADFLEDCGEDRYGKSEKVLCPFLDVRPGGKSQCGIYAYRNAVCSTYFCRYDDGAAGERFWESLQTMVMQVELALGQWALSAVGFDVKAYVRRMNAMAPRIGAVSAASATGGWAAAARREAWGRDFGREVEIYIACAEAVTARQDELWKIANGTEIDEADAFETASQTLVDPRHREQIQDDFSDPDRETIPPSAIWRTVRRRYRQLLDLRSAAPAAAITARNKPGKPCS